MSSRWNFGCRKYLAVEPVALFFCYGLFMSLPVMQQFVYYRISQYKGFPYSVSRDERGQSCGYNGSEANTTMKELEKEVRRVGERTFVVLSFGVQILSYHFFPHHVGTRTGSQS